jgi:tRNA (guanine37-N1)-methyltransferase
MRFDILTIFPNFFGDRDTGIFGHGILERALRNNLASAHTHDLRAFTHDRHRTVDDRPFGGGEGMVLKPQPIYEALESLALPPKPTRAATKPQIETVILLSAQGKPFTQSTARRLATLDRVVLICGRYEGVDERVSQLLSDEELSIGDYVLSGGELAAAILIDAVVRLLPGVLGHADSSKFESFGEADEPTNLPDDGVPRSTNAANGLLDYPHYTRPAEFLGVSIPEPLGNGDHLAIRRWRRQAALAKTHTNRPDLLTHADLTDDDREFLATLNPIDQ